MKSLTMCTIAMGNHTTLRHYDKGLFMMKSIYTKFTCLYLNQNITEIAHPKYYFFMFADEI